MSLPFRLASPPANSGWRVQSSLRAHDGAYVQVDEVRVSSPTRQDPPTPWTVVRRKPAVGIAAFLEDGRWLLIRQERIPVMQELWEFPAGQVDAGHHEDAEAMRLAVEATALNELREEAGLTLAKTGELHHVGHVFLSPGFTDEVCYLLLAGPMVQSSARQTVGGEVITAEMLCTQHELHQMVQRGELTNGLSLALYAKILAHPLI
jgi:ADP-ribose pyrophosphatase